MRPVVAGAAVAVVALLVSTRAQAVEKLFGEGESWPGPAVQELQKQSAEAVAPFEQVLLDAGEATARQDLASGLADYAVTSVPLSAADTTAATVNGRTVAYVPYMAGAVAVVVALDVDLDHGGGRISQLNLTVPTLAKLFTHNINVWSDPEIVAENPDQTNLGFLKQAQVGFAARKDSSSSTAAMISLFLSDPEAKVIWNAYANSLGAPVDTPLDAWPNDPVNTAHLLTSGSKGMVDFMLGLDPSDDTKTLPGATSHYIGYLAPSWADRYNAPKATLVSSDAAHLTRISASADSVGKALAAGTVDATTNLVTLKYGVAGDGAYPAALVSYLAVPTKGLTATGKAAALANFIRFVLGDAGQKVVADTGYVPVSPALRTAGLAVADQVAAQSGSAAAQTATTTTTTTVGASITTTTVAADSTTSTTSTTTDSTTAALSTAASTPSLAASTSGTPVATSASSAGSGRLRAEDLSLPRTGSPPLWPRTATALGMVVIGESLRRRLRRPRSQS